MNSQDWQNVIGIMRRAPLQNMDEAAGVAALIEKVKQHAETQMSLEEPANDDIGAGDTD